MENNQLSTKQSSSGAEAQPEQPSTNNNKLFVVTTVTVLLTTVIAGSAVYFWQKSANERAISDLEQKIASLEAQILTTKKVEIPQPTSVLSPTPTPDLTEDWLTYSNSDIVYTFKYPSNVSLTEKNNTIQLYLQGPTQRQNTEFYDGIMLIFSLPFQIGNVSLSEYVDQEIEQSKQNADILEEKTKINVAGIEGFTYTAQGLGTSKYIYLQSSDKTWTVKIINGTNDPTNQGYNNTVDQILSTFKFTK